ncbi:dihydrofolate reductase [Peribacillus frigoritolerans]|jgi:dihydrofolate reductase|uniref:dihydrofolate reductase n=1 Tax=Peribacillus TaxID=2675229 RepID=UPI0005512ADC|nr:dihydrofolate reductase [Peribacillus frigoritolerans]MBT2602891.1 dihydrofolate reductase [Bacillus sp. ISL-53]PCD08937.1 dihydrofolate reductase [Peribacillus simplex]PEF38532.1 dihydrofolate reductase [Bacillus sp. AFS094228]PEO47505.1 dihydrofolate reductase [Bacillus sp. AFS026049]PHD78050.1 dihydrofolate reductase [Bacillus sp. AFS043905]QNK47665.1 dihydrofolate reductase [Brevibacterium sp. PAMC23299]
MISLIVAMDQNRVIGKNNKLPWHLPADLQYFKKVTMGHPIVMGRKTFESIGRVLPGRENVIVTRNQEFKAEGCVVLHDIAQIKMFADNHEEEVFVIGGAEIFKEILPFTDRLYITEIHETFEGDTFFPEIDENEWDEISSNPGNIDEKNRFAHDFIILQKK